MYSVRGRRSARGTPLSLGSGRLSAISEAQLGSAVTTDDEAER